MKTESKAAFTKRMQSITIPDGFTAAMREEKDGWVKGQKTYLVYTLTKPDDTKIEFDQYGSGHTKFLTEKGWRTFDRTGVEDSFYHLPFEHEKGKKIDLNALVAEQLARIEKSRDYFKSAISVPGLPNFTVAPDRVAKLKADLKKFGVITFTPSGFGTGYSITKKPTRGLRYGESRAKPELEAFLGHSPLYVSTMDCD